MNELQRFESIARTQQDCELILVSTRNKHEQEMMNLNERLQMAQMNLQEKVRLFTTRPDLTVVLLGRRSRRASPSIGVRL